MENTNRLVLIYEKLCQLKLEVKLALEVSDISLSVRGVLTRLDADLSQKKEELWYEMGVA